MGLSGALCYCHSRTCSETGSPLSQRFGGSFHYWVYLKHYSITMVNMFIWEVWKGRKRITGSCSDFHLLLQIDGCWCSPHWPSQAGSDLCWQVHGCWFAGPDWWKVGSALDYTASVWLWHGFFLKKTWISCCLALSPFHSLFFSTKFSLKNKHKSSSN